MTKYINVTPHDVVVGEKTFPTMGKGVAARVSSQYSEILGGEATKAYGQIYNLPEPQKDVKYIVSGIVFEAAVKAGRLDVVAPATDHPLVVRSDKGHIVSVPCFVKPG